MNDFLPIDRLLLVSGDCYRFDPKQGVNIRGFDTFLLLSCLSNPECDGHIWKIRAMLPDEMVVTFFLDSLPYSPYEPLRLGVCTDEKSGFLRC
jgi:hypothetical protein